MWCSLERLKQNPHTRIAMRKRTSKLTKRSSAKSLPEEIEEMTGDMDLPKDVSPAPPKSAKVFETAADQSHLPQAPNLMKGFKEIAQKIFDSPLDIMEEFDIIEGSLSITGALTPQVINRAANQSEDMARRAYRIYICAKVEYEAYMRESEGLVAAIRDASTAKLEQEKATGVRTKQITEGDVKAYCASQYPDQWEEINRRRDRAKGMMGYLEQLSDLSKKRCFTVARMLSPNGEL